MTSDDELYIGYLPSTPPSYARRLRWCVPLIATLLIGAGTLLAGLQAPFDPGVFEYLEPRELTGRVELAPYPTLAINRPGMGPESLSPVSRYLVVGVGKHGADRALAAHDARVVRLEGTLVYRGERTMVELVDGSVEPLSPPAVDHEPGAALELGEQTLRGEIVDSKCFLGVMKPGRSKPHRACAVRCLSGGIPPLFLVETAAGESLGLVLTGADGKSLGRAALAWVGEPITITGQVERHGDLLLLKADPSRYRRLEG